MKIEKKAIETDRAYVRYRNIQHISWARKNDDVLEVKIHTSNNSPIIQNMSNSDFDIFLKAYKDYFVINLSNLSTENANLVRRRFSGDE